MQQAYREALQNCCRLHVSFHMKTDCAERHETSTASYWPLAILLGAVAGIWVLSGWFLYPLNDRGTFGDMFGAVNALFSGLAFASLIYTIILQKKELQLQRQELVFTRAELEGQKLQLSAQNEVLKVQNFENTFFQLLRLLNDIINSIDLTDSKGNVTRGRDCLTSFYRRLRNIYVREKSGHNFQDELLLIKHAYSSFYEDHQTELGHYFCTLYNIIKFVRNSNVQDKSFYTNLVRAQLSSQELLLLFYNALSDLGSEKFKPLIEEFALLKTVPQNLLLDNEAHPSLYSHGAYAKANPPLNTDAPPIGVAPVS